MVVAVIAVGQMGLFLLGAESHKADPRAAERALWSEIVRVQYEPVGESELRRVKRRVESQRLYAQEEVLGMARTLAGYEALGGYELTDTFMERLRAVTADDVMRVANTYIKLAGAALVEYLPAQDNTPEFSSEQIIEELYDAQANTEVMDQAPESAPEDYKQFSFHPSSTPFDAVARELALPWGGMLYYKTRRDLPLVSVTALFQGGKRGETISNCGITNLMLKSTLKGTQKYSAERRLQTE